MKKILNILMVITVLAACLTGCSSQPVIALEGDATQIEVGETIVASLEKGVYKDIHWLMSDEKVARISNEGVITGITKGEAEIIVIVDGKKATRKISVVAPAIIDVVPPTEPSPENDALMAQIKAEEALKEHEEANEILLADVYIAIIAAQPEDAEELVFFEDSNPELIESFYPGLEKVELAQLAMYMPPVVTHPCEIVLAEVKNSEDVQSVIDIFQARIDAGAAETEYPESAEGWKQFAEVQTEGNFVGMLVLPKDYIIPENVFEIIK